jgi:hypothetical protein
MWYLMGEKWVFFKLGECPALVISMLKGFYRSATSFQVHGFESSSYQGYNSIAEAEAAWEHACACGVIGNPSSPMKKTPTSPASIQKASVPHPPTTAIITSPSWLRSYSNLPSCLSSESSLNFSSTADSAVQELLPQ